jgi:hypothetical protein
MSWTASEMRLPKHGQRVVVVWGDDFKVGRFDAKHPFAPVIVDSSAGKFYRNFSYWKPLNFPKVKP